VYTSELNADPYKEIKAIRSKNAAPAHQQPPLGCFFPHDQHNGGQAFSRSGEPFSGRKSLLLTFLAPLQRSKQAAYFPQQYPLSLDFRCVSNQGSPWFNAISAKGQNNTICEHLAPIRRLIQLTMAERTSLKERRSNND
jgi:hypothetical protein